MADNKLPFALSFERQYAGPLDPTMVFATEVERMAYLSSPLCYPGQIVTCTQFSKDKNIYIVNRTKTDYITISNTIASITGLQPELSLKAEKSHTHTIANIDTLQARLDAIDAHTHVELNDVLVLYSEYNVDYTYDEEALIWNIKSELDYYPNLANVKFIYVYNPLNYPSEPLIFNAVRGQVDANGVMSEEGVLNIVRLPNYADIRRLQDGKAALSHMHTIANITSLQAALDAKAANGHTHTIANVTGLQTALDAKAANGHTHTIANVTGLQTALDAKAALAHTHEIANVTGLQAKLDTLTALSGLDGKVFAWQVVGTNTIIDGLIVGNQFQFIMSITDNNANPTYSEILNIFGPLTKGTIVYQTYESKLTEISLEPSYNTMWMIFHAFKSQTDVYSDMSMFGGTFVNDSFANMINYSDASRNYYYGGGQRPRIDSAIGVKVTIGHDQAAGYTGYRKREILFTGTIQNWAI